MRLSRSPTSGSMLSQIPEASWASSPALSFWMAGLDFWRKMVGDPEAPAALVYGGDRSHHRSGVAVYSWSTL